MFDKDENQLDDFFGLQPENEDKKRQKSLKETIRLSFRTKLRLLPKVLATHERYAILIFSIIILGSIIAIPVTSYFRFTEPHPDFGGSFSEGILGEPHFINPLLAQSNDADRDLAGLIYSSLLKYDSKGQLVPDLAKSYEISPDGLSYTVYLRDDAFWHDGTQITTDDIIFTIRLAQNPDYGSRQRVNWGGVDIEKVNGNVIIFKLQNKYAQFLVNLTLGIMPQHLWEEVTPINFSLSELNLKPVGSGPYKFKRLLKNKLGRIISYELEANKEYYADRPYIENIELFFYNSKDEMIDAYNKNQIENIGSIPAGSIELLKFQNRIDVNTIQLPRYFAIFFNQNQSEILSDKNIRLALNHATDKEEIIQEVLGGYGVEVNSPIITSVIGITNGTNLYGYSRDLAQKILDENGWIDTSEDAIRTKGEEKLSLKLTTSNLPELVHAADIIKRQWGNVGVDISIEVLPIPQLKQVIRDRDYQMLLFGEILSLDPDPFSLWHSSQKKDPGLNLALYDNDTADTLLNDARQTLGPLERMQKYDDFQKLVVADIPAVFLYNPFYIYGQTKKIKGFETELMAMPSDRFNSIESWYIKTKRILKD